MKKFFATAVFCAMALPATTLAAPSNDELLQMIKDLKAQVAAKDVDLADKSIGDESVTLRSHQEKSYLTFESADGNFKYKIDGRIMLDTGFVANDKDAAGENTLRTDTRFRRLRFGIKGYLHDDWKGEFDFDIRTKKTGSDLDSSSDAIKAKDMWIGYTGFKNTSIMIGNHKPMFSIGEMISSRWGTFMEAASVIEAFAPGRRMGLSVINGDEKYYWLGVTLMGDEYDAEPSDSNEGWGVSTRAIAIPYMSDDRNTVVHIGINYLNAKAQGNEGVGKMDIKVGPEAEFVYSVEKGEYPEYMKAKNIDGSNRQQVYGLEVAGKWHKLSWIAEYMKCDIETVDNYPEPSFDGFYVMASYFLSDDQRPYDAGDAEFAGIIPKGKWGAHELAVRYSELDLNDRFSQDGGDIRNGTGKAEAITLAYNWYINNNFLVKTNYIHTKYDENATGDGNDYTGNDKLDIFGMRFQYLF